jgi:TonB family protein
MKSLLLALFACLLLGQPLVAAPQDDAKKAPAESPELVEAAQLNVQAVGLYNEKKYDEALPLARRVLEIREKQLAADHELVVFALLNLGSIYLAKANYDDAQAIYKRALTIQEKKFGADNSKLLNAMDNLALLSFALRNNGRAEDLYKRALAIREKAYGAEHLETAYGLLGLAVFYERIDKYAKAVEFYKRALAIKEKRLAPDHPEIAELLAQCSCALSFNDQLDESKQYRERAEKIQQLAPINPLRKGLLQGSAIYKVEPVYPAEARRAGVRGTVVVTITVDECGRVIDAQALSGPGDLKDASVKAARRWRFSSTKLGTRPVKVIGTITFNFNR